MAKFFFQIGSNCSEEELKNEEENEEALKSPHWNDQRSQEMMSEDEANNDDGSVSPKEVGHNIYILCHQLALYNKEIGQLLKSVPGDHKVAQALNYYSSHTAQIEVVRQDKSLEQVI